MEDKVVVCWNNPAVTNYCLGKAIPATSFVRDICDAQDATDQAIPTTTVVKLIMQECHDFWGKKIPGPPPPSSVWNPARLIVVTVANIIVEIEYGYYCFVMGIKQQSCPRVHQKQSERI